jgi:Toastrack DUF4097
MDRDSPVPKWARAVGIVTGFVTVVLAADVVLALAVQLNSVTVDVSSVRQLPFAAGEALVLTVNGVDVHAKRGRSGVLVLRDDLRVAAPTRAAAAGLSRGAELKTRDDGRTLRVDAQAAPTALVLGPGRRRSLTVEVPPGVDVYVRSSEGSVSVSGPGAALDVAAASGDVMLDDLMVAQDVRARVGTGSIRFRGVVLGGSLDLATDTGDVTVSLPGGTAATLDALAMEGSVAVTGLWRVPVADLAGGQSASGLLGDGTGGSIRLASTVGDIRVQADTIPTHARKPADAG